MRNREVIEREMHNAREDLEASLAELRHVVQEKVDVKARALVAVEKGKLAAEDLIVRGIVEAKTLADKSKAGARDLLAKGQAGARDLANRSKASARDLYTKGRETVEERPVLIGSIAAGVIAVGAFLYIAHRRDWI